MDSGLVDQLDDPSYEFKYLDLVDADNGNVRLTASKPITVYWPYPEGTGKNTDFVLLHYLDLDREMAAKDAQGEIEASQVEAVNIKKLDDHIEFTVDSFSPFALAWGASSIDVTVGATTVLEGRDLAAGEFTFELRDQDGKLVSTTVNAADGSVTFDPLHFTKPGVYTYTISEKVGDLDDVTYDTSVHTVTITVSANADGTLSASVSYDGSADRPIFTSTYTGQTDPSDPDDPNEPSKPGDSDGQAKPDGDDGSLPQTGDRTPLLAVGTLCAALISVIGAVSVLRRCARR